jgi:hypothetical protein
MIVKVNAFKPSKWLQVSRPYFCNCNEIWKKKKKMKKKTDNGVKYSDLNKQFILNYCERKIFMQSYTPKTFGGAYCHGSLSFCPSIWNSYFLNLLLI